MCGEEGLTFSLLREAPMNKIMYTIVYGGDTVHIRRKHSYTRSLCFSHKNTVYDTVKIQS